MQVNIAVCDDEVKVSSQVENILMKLLKERLLKYEIDIFDSGESLCKEMERTEYDLIFLDIELPEMNGVEIGNYIREIKRNNIVQIAYISSKQEYAMELFDIRPINFLVKPLEEATVAKVIDAYIKINGGKTNVFQYKKGHAHRKVEIHKIMYFIRNSRKAIMYTSEGIQEFYESLEKIYERIKNYGFLFIHKSYMVNYRYIKKIGYDYLIMADGEEFPISQSRRKEIREMYKKMEEE